MGEYFYQFVLFLYHLLFNNFGLTIIALAVLSRAIFFPLFSSQIKQQKKWEKLKPQLDGLNEKHKNDKKTLAAEQARLMKEAGVNPLAGCLPLILQLVIINLLYSAFYKFLKTGLNTHFLIWNLSNPDTFKIFLGKSPLVLPGLLVIIASFTQYIQTKMMMPKKAATTELTVKPKEEKKEGLASSLAESQSMMVWMFPLMFLFLGTKWPSGLALYWAVATIVAIAQQYFLNKQK